MEDKGTNIKKNVVDLQENINNLSQEILGYGDTIATIIDNDVTKVNFDRYGVNKAKSVQNNLFNIKGKDKGSNYQISDRIYSEIANPSVDPNFLSGLLTGRHALNMELNYILNEMIELQSAVDMLADDVVFPNASATSGIKIEFTGNDENDPNEKYDALIKYFRPLDSPLHTIRYKKLYSYNIEEDVKNIVRSFAVYGHQMVATIPYKKIAADLLYEKEIENRQNNITNSGEAYFFMKKSYNNKNKAYSESINLDKVHIPGVDILSKNLKHLCLNTPYSEENMEYVSLLMENEKLWVEDKPKIKPIKGDIGTLLSKGENDESPLLHSVEVLKQKNTKKFNIDGLLGCTHDILDPNRTVPVYIKDELLGVYVIEKGIYENQVELGSNMANLTNSSTIIDGLNKLTSSAVYSTKLKSIMLKDVRDILNSNLDKRFLRNNPSLLEDIEFILNREGIDNIYKSRIRFIPSEFITLHKIGVGPLGTPLLLKARSYAHMHINLLKSDMLSKMFLEKPRYKVKIPYDGETSNLARIKQSVESFKYAIPRLSDVAIPDVVNTSSANYHTIVMPVNNQGTELYEIEQLPVLEGRDNTDYLRHLRNQATMTVGYPADLFDPSTQIDFAKKIANINNNTLIKIISLQNSLSLSMSELCSKRIKYLTGNENIDVIISFEIPSDITNNVNKEIFDQKNAISDIMFEFVDKSPAVEDRHKEQVKQYINKRIMEGIIDFDLLNEAIEKVTTYQAGTREVEE